MLSWPHACAWFNTDYRIGLIRLVNEVPIGTTFVLGGASAERER